MKVKQFMGMLLLLWLQNTAIGQPSANLSLTNPPAHSQQIAGGEIITRKGVIYKGVSVEKIVPDGLVISYSQTGGGISIAKLEFKDLSDSLQRQFGYNPTNAATFESQQRRAEGQWRAKWVADEQKAETARREQEIADAESQAKMVGTGFFISNNGYLLTCFHVVAKATSIQVGTELGLFDAELVQSDPDDDLALLKVAGTFSSLPLVSSKNVNLGEEVFTIGFPDPFLQGWQPKLTSGEISSLAGIRDNTNSYQISVPIQPGNSGGAVVDEYGNVVGLVQATLKDSTVFAVTGTLPQNVNYAIKSSVAKTFLGSVPEDWPLKLKPEYPSTERKYEDVVKTTEDAVAVVLVQ